MTAILWGADALILFSDIDGVYDKNPKEHADAKLIELVTDIEELKATISMDSKSDFGTGGMVTKIEAAQKVLDYGIAMILANGGIDQVLDKLVNAEAKGTVFVPTEQ